jgi:hypothetical protein
LSGLLLGSNALTALLADDIVLHTWLSGRADLLHTTTPSVAIILALVERMEDITQRRRWSEKLTEDVPRRFGPRLRAFDLAAAKEWSALYAQLSGIASFEAPDGELFEISIAIAEGLIYLEARAPWHGAVRNLRQHDPWTDISYPN